MWTGSPDGEAQRRIAELPGLSFPAAPDPRGRVALVVTAEDGPRGHREGMWLVPLGEGRAAPFGPRSERIRNPAFTADGATVVFEADLESYRDLYTIPREGGAIRRLTDAPHGSFEPAVGERLAFGTSRDGNAEIYVANLDGTDPVRLTHDPTDDVSPAWRPDSGRLAWIHGSRVWTMAPDGNDARPLRSRAEQALELAFAWSPDGTRIAVTVQTGPREVDVEVVDASTGAVLTRLGGPGVDEMPAWSPDGAWLVYAAGGDLLRVDRDGQNPRQLTFDAAPDWLPRWVAEARP